MTLIIQDRFDGAAGDIGGWPGNVVGRTTDSGHVWRPGAEGKDLRLDGSGAVTGNYPQNSGRGDVWCAAQMPLADYWVELDVFIPTNDSDSYFMIYTKIQTEPNPSYGNEDSKFSIASWFPVNSSYPEVMELGGFGTLGPTYSGTARGDATYGTRTFRVTVVGTTVSAYIDGAFISSGALTGAIPNNGWVGFGMRSRNDDGSLVSFARVLEFRAGTIADYAGIPPSFWTSRVGSTEVLA